MNEVTALKKQNKLNKVVFTFFFSWLMPVKDGRRNKMILITDEVRMNRKFVIN
jgi:hypothetical protein